tara:strand:- start:125413 stop:127020 length:1608 start_codon:yes stop_codon:yes gene_type:complete
MNMSLKRFAQVLALIAVVSIIAYVVRYHNISHDSSLDERMQLEPYQKGMDLRAVFETFPQWRDGLTDLRLLQDNALAWAARWELLQQATQHLDISYFILKEDIFGLAFLGHLLEKAEQGVQVRVLLDGYGSRLSRRPQGNDYIDTLVNTGRVDIRLYRPLLNRALDGVISGSLSVMVASEHDKVLVADQRRAIIGGRNIATEYFAAPGEADTVFIDLGVDVDDTGVGQALVVAFEAQYFSERAHTEPREVVDMQSQRRDLHLAYQMMDAWLRQGTFSDSLQTSINEHEKGSRWQTELEQFQSLRGRLKDGLGAFDRAQVRVLDSTTRLATSTDPISEAGIRLLAASRASVLIQNPFVVLAQETVDALAQTVAHEVPVNLLTNSPVSAKSVFSQAFFLRQWAHLLAAVPTLTLYGNATDEMIHAKLAVFDGVLSLVGTYNLSPLSMGTNSEVMLAIWSEDIASRLAAPVKQMIASGEPAVYQYSIKRDSQDRPLLDDNGNPVADLGPLDHFDLSSKPKLRALLTALELMPGESPFF